MAVLKHAYYVVFMVLFITEQPLAQNQKVGYIESDVIMQYMPEYAGIEQQLQLLSDTWRQEINDMENELEELNRDFEAREILFTDEIRQQRIAEIEQLRNELDSYIEQKFGAQGEYFTQQKEFLEPIQRSIFDALNSVATRDNFDFVFDRSEDIRFLYVRQEWNLTDEVMLELGIDATRN